MNRENYLKCVEVPWQLVPNYSGVKISICEDEAMVSITMLVDLYRSTKEIDIATIKIDVFELELITFTPSCEGKFSLDDWSTSNKYPLTTSRKSFKKYFEI